MDFLSFSFFADLLAARPAIAEAISHVLTDHQVALETAQRGATVSAQTRETQRNEMLDNIRHFFGLAD